MQGDCEEVSCRGAAHTKAESTDGTPSVQGLEVHPEPPGALRLSWRTNMPRKPQSIKRRAASYASGKRQHGVLIPSDAHCFAKGWEDGYRAALRDVQKIGGRLVDVVGDELQRALLNVVTSAAKTFQEELEKLP